MWAAIWYPSLSCTHSNTKSAFLLSQQTCWQTRQVDKIRKYFSCPEGTRTPIACFESIYTKTLLYFRVLYHNANVLTSGSSRQFRGIWRRLKKYIYKSCFLKLSEAIETIKTKMSSEHDLTSKNQKELEKDLTSTKHNLLDVRYQLTLAEKVSWSIDDQ